MNENDQIYGSKGGIVNKVSIPSRKTSDAKQQQKSMKMIKSLVIQEGSKSSFHTQLALKHDLLQRLVLQNHSQNQ